MITQPLPVAGQAGGTVKKSRFSPVSNLMMALTDQCNLLCEYCFVRKTPRKMSLATARKAVEFFLHRNITGVQQQVTITFFGGEPLLELGLMGEVIAYARGLGAQSGKRVQFAATTNGTIAGPKVEKLIRQADMQMLISVDGTAEATASRPFLSGRSSYPLVARNLRPLMAAAKSAVVRTTFHPAALALKQNVAHVLELGAPSVVLAPVVESDWRGSEDKLEQAYQELADWFIDEARAGRLLPLESSWIFLRQLHRARSGGGRPARPCGVGQTLLGVDPDGQIMPCHRFLYRPQDWLGTVDKPEMSIARHPYLDLSSRDILGCHQCSAEKLCGGGCRSVVLDSLYKTHPGHCLTMRAHARAVERIYDTLTLENHQAFRHVLRSPTQLTDALAEIALN